MTVTISSKKNLFRLFLLLSLLALPFLAFAQLPTRKLSFLKNLADVGSMLRGQGLSRRGYVVDVRTQTAYPQGQAAPDTPTVSRMMATLLMKLTGRPTGQAAWATWFGPGDKVGVLIDPKGSGTARVHTATVAAVVGGLRAAGVQSNDIIVFSANAAELSGGGFPLNWSKQGVRFVGVDQLPVDNRHRFTLKAGFMGRTVPISSVISMCRYIINISPFMDHPVLGARLALANQVLVSFKQGNEFERHWGGAVGIGEIATWPLFRKKFVLHIIDGLTGTFDGQSTAWHPQIYLASTDPVALDRVAFGLIDSTRRENGLPIIYGTQRNPRYIDVAAMNHAGEGNNDKINHQIINLK
jgi:hypothetical protein